VPAPEHIKQAFPPQGNPSLTGLKMGWDSPLRLLEVSRACLHGVGFEVNLSTLLCQCVSCCLDVCLGALQAQGTKQEKISSNFWYEQVSQLVLTL